ncbi:MAG: hypothetical protein ACREMA_06385, partial [Longimicrobiales bacterium]
MATPGAVEYRDRWRELARIPLGLAAAGTAWFTVILLTSGLAGNEPFWIGEAAASAVSAAVWMAAGLAVARRTRAAAPIIFLFGAALAWFLSRGIVHSVSPYYGLFSFSVACCAGGLVWSVGLSPPGRLYARLAAIAVSLVTPVTVVAVTLATPDLGVTRVLSDATSQSKRVSMLVVEHGREHTMYLWLPAGKTIVPGARDSTVALEPDPGSGPGRYRVIPLRNEAEIADLCKRFRVQSR